MKLISKIAAGSIVMFLVFSSIAVWTENVQFLLQALLFLCTVAVCALMSIE